MELNNEIITGIVGIVTAAISSLTTWLLARKKYNTEADHNVIDNMKESLEFYDILSDDSKKRLTEVIEENKIIREEFGELLLENKALKKELELLKSQVIKLSTSICYDLSCKMRIREEDLTRQNNKNEENSTQ